MKRRLLPRNFSFIQHGPAAAKTAVPDSQCTQCHGTGTIPGPQYFVSRGNNCANGGAATGSASCNSAGSTTGTGPAASVAAKTSSSNQTVASQAGAASQSGAARYHRLLVPSDARPAAGVSLRSMLSDQAPALRSRAGLDSTFGRSAADSAASSYGWWHTMSETRTPRFWAGAVAASGLVYGGFYAGQQLAQPNAAELQSGGALVAAAAMASDRPRSPRRSLSPFFIADAAEKVSPAVVNIKVRHLGQTCDGNTNGSGFIIDAGGLVVTNTHIVADAIDQADGGTGGGPEAPLARALITVTLQDGRCLTARLVNYDWRSDLALLRVEAGSKEVLPVAQLGSSRLLRAGEWVVALGSPLHLTNSVSAGIVSAVGRRGSDLGLAGGGDYIQTDAACNTGSSGGPLVNVQGEVIGISNMKAMAADGVSFAIPIDSARAVIAKLLADPSARAPPAVAGAKTMTLTPAMAANLSDVSDSFSAGQPAGVYVPYVEPGGPADRAGMRAGDTIVGVAGMQGPVSETALQQHADCCGGGPMRITVSRSDGTFAALSLPLPR